MIKKLGGIFVVMLLTACTSTGDSTAANNTKSNADDDLVCEFKAQTGSNRKKRTCMTKELADEMRRETQHALRSQEHKGQTSAGTY